MQRDGQRQRRKKPVIGPCHEKMMAGLWQWKRNETNCKTTACHDNRDGTVADSNDSCIFGG